MILILEMTKPKTFLSQSQSEQNHTGTNKVLVSIQQEMFRTQQNNIWKQT